MDEKLWQTALAAQNNAYVPYSHFPVGAALETAEGEIIPGANVENASYPLGCCAERTAIYRAASEGHRQFRRILIVGPGPELISPCGGCRQVLAEFGDMEVIMAESSRTLEPRVMRLHELLPASFTKEDLHGV